MFGLHNSIEVECGNYKRVSLNEILDVKTPIKDGVAFAKYLVFGHKGGAFFKQVSLRKINSNPLNGVMCAEYAVSLKGDEYCGLEFLYFGLSYDGVKLCNRAEFDPFVKEEGASLNVSVTVFLECVGEDRNSLVGGDNQLVRFLLGSRARGQIAHFVSKCNHPMLPMTRVRANEITVLSVVESTLGGLSFEAKELSPVPSEVVFTMGGLAILRVFVHEGCFFAYSKASTVNVYGYIPIGQMNVERIVSTNKSGSFASGTCLGFVPLQLFRTDGVLDCMCGHNTVFKGDKFSCFGAVLSDGEVRFYGLDDNGRIKERFRVATKASATFGKMALDVLDNGYLVLYEGDCIRVFDSFGEAKGVYAVKTDKKNLTVLDGGKLHYVKISQGVLSRYRLDGDTAELLGEEYVGNNSVLFRSLNSVGVCSDVVSRLYNLLSGGGADNAFLLDFWTKYGQAVDMEFGNGGCVIHLIDGSKMLIPVSAIGSSVAIDKDSSVSVFNEFFLVSGNGVKKLYAFNGSAGTFSSVSGQFLADDVVDGISLGDYIALKRMDGTVETLYKNRDIAFAYNPSLNVGDEVTLVLRVCGNTLLSNKVNVGVQMDIG